MQRDVNILASEDGETILGITTPTVLCRSTYRLFKRIHDHSSFSLANLTKVCALLDFQSKNSAVELVCNSIPSLSTDHVHSSVFRSVGGSKVHTWGIVTRDRRQKLLSTIVFRKHSRLEIVELLYIATNYEHRGFGFGRHLLDELISIWKDEGYSYVLTHADLSASGFFERLSFNMSTPFPRDLFDAWVDKYSKSVLMCRALYEPGLYDDESRTYKLVSILIASENTDKSPVETWVCGSLLYESDDIVMVQYSFHQRLYTEILHYCSKRLQEF